MSKTKASAKAKPAEPAPRLLTQEEVERVRVTHISTNNQGWKEDNRFVFPAKIYYLGKCQSDGDMFMELTKKYIHIYKGHLNAEKP
jgi:hypothetical protein